MTTASPLQGGCRRHLPRRAVHKTPRYSRKTIQPLVNISGACQCYRFLARPPAAHLTSRHATHFAVCFCKNNAPIRHRRGRMAWRKSQMLPLCTKRLRLPNSVRANASEKFRQPLLAHCAEKRKRYKKTDTARVTEKHKNDALQMPWSAPFVNAAAMRFLKDLKYRCTYKTNLRYLSVGQRKIYFGKCLSSAVFAKAENYRKKEQACKSVKKEQACKADLFHWARQNLTLPGRVRPSTIGELRLNFCVRYENRWIPQS